MSTAALDLSRLVINGLVGSKHYADLVDAVTSLTMRETITGASTVDITVQDEHRTLLRAVATTTRSTVQLDGAGFELAAVHKNGTSLQLTYEDMAVAALRGKHGARAVAAGVMSRAQFCATLAREVSWIKVAAAPGAKSLVQLARGTGVKVTSASIGGDVGGWGNYGTSSVSPSNPRTSAAALSQSEVYSLALQVGLSPAKATVAAAIAMAESTGEPTAHNQVPPDDSYGLWQINMIGGLGPERRRAFGLASDAALFDPVTNAKAMASLSGKGAHFSPWSTYTSGAYRSHLSAAVSAVSLTAGVTASAQVSKKGNASKSDDEDSWSAIGRILGEIGWRACVVRGTLYLAPDSFLISRARDAYDISESSKGVDNIDFDWDTGKPAATATMTVWAGIHALAAGSPVNLSKMGPADGKWLVETIDRSPFTRLCTVTLVRPQPTLPEPKAAASTSAANSDAGEGGWGLPVDAGSTSSGVSNLTTEHGGGGLGPGAGSGSVSDRFVTAALTAAGKPYVWGTSGPNTFDCSGLVQWAAAKVGVHLSKPVTSILAHVTHIPVSQAVNTRGALLLRARGSEHHVAISLGNGRTIEARGKAYGCGLFSATSGRDWTTGGLIPGIPPG